MLRLLACLAVLLLGFAAPARATGAGADSYFSFTGDCTEPSCGGDVSAQLVLLNYTQGNQLATNFVSFTYDGSDLLAGFTVTAGGGASASGILGPGLPGDFDVTVDAPDEGTVFQSYGSEGAWCAGGTCDGDYGDSAVWAVGSAPVPEPASVALLGFALAGLGAMRARRLATSAPRE